MNSPGFNAFGSTRAVNPRKPKSSDVPVPKLRPSMTLAHLGALSLCAEIEMLGGRVVALMFDPQNQEIRVQFVEDGGVEALWVVVIGMTDEVA